MGFHLIGLAVDIANRRIVLTDIGTGAMIGGLLGELGVRLASTLGRRPTIDGWREGMFFGGLVTFLIWAFSELEA